MAVLLPFVGLYARTFMDVKPEEYPLVTFFPIVVFVSMFFGTGSAIISLVLSILLVWFYIMPPEGSFLTPDVLPLFILSAILLAIIHFISLSRRYFKRFLEEEERTKTLLAERELLFRELQHRVANNMMFIAGMLGKQKAKMIADPERIAETCDESINRITHMGNLHRKLHSIDFKETLDVGIRQICHDFENMISSVKIVFDLDCDNIRVSANQFTNLALLIHEILSNSVKHAFRGREEGHVWITARCAEDNITVSISDDGPGIQQCGTGLGMQIIKGLISQLAGTLTVPESGDSTYEITFPREVLGVD